jgi:peptide/nickel transport system substrate-binding protein
MIPCWSGSSTTNPHALSPKIKQFVQAQHWFQDLTTIGVE